MTGVATLAALRLLSNCNLAALRLLSNGNLAALEEVAGGAQPACDAVIGRDGSDKRVCAARAVLRRYE